MKTEDKAYASVRTAGAMLEALTRAVPDGMTNKALADAAGCSPSQVSRLAPVLQDMGWLVKLPTGNFCITAQFGRMTFRVMSGFDNAERALADQRRNFTVNQ